MANDASGGGFAVVLGNPPWERVKLQEQEFFSSRDPAIAGAPNAAARKRAIAALKDTNPALLAEFREASRKAEGESHLMRNSGRYPLCGRGDINTYAVFAETARDAIAPTGRLGIIVPSGIATDDTTKFFFGDMVESQTLAELLSFENEEFIFPGVHHSYCFSLMVVSGRSALVSEMQFVFFARRVSQLDPAAGRRFTLTAEDIRLLNPNTLTCPVFRSERDAEITKGIYHRVPVLFRESRDGQPESNPWSITFLRMFDLTNDSGLFVEPEVACPAVAKSLAVDSEAAPPYLPLYEAKMLHQFDHRWATYAPPGAGWLDGALNTRVDPRGDVVPDARDMTLEEHEDPDACVAPRYWVATSAVDESLVKYQRDPDTGEQVEVWRWDRDWLLGWRDISRASNDRTVIASVLPRAAVGNSIALMLPAGKSAKQYASLIACLGAFVYDYVSRLKVGGTHVNFFIMQQTAVLPPELFARACAWDQSSSVGEWITPRVLELVYTAHDLAGFARDLGYDGPPFRWNESRRARLRAELDAAFLHLYNVSRDDVAYILDTFTVFKTRDEQRNGGVYKTKELILAIYDAMAEAIDRQSAQIGTHVQTPSKPPLTALAGDEVYRFVTPKREERYQHCVPRIDLKAAAGAFGESQEPEFREWVAINSPTPLVKGMFVAQVVGRSMEPLIPNGAYCLFQRKRPQLKDGLVGLFQLHEGDDAEAGGRFTVKRLRIESRSGDEGVERSSTLVPENSAFSPMEVTEENISFAAEFVEVLQPLERHAEAGAVTASSAWISPLDPPPGDPRAAHTPETMARAARPAAPAVVVPQMEIDLDRLLVAFRDVREGMSADYVVAEPAMNERFLAAARSAGLRAEAALLNKALLNLRKAGKLKDEERSKQYRLRKQYGPYIFTSEWSVRHLQRALLEESNRMPALDELLCNPEWAARFDEIAARIKPGFDSIDYRWAALAIRKRGRSQPEPETLELPMHRQLTLAEWRDPGVPTGAGLYLIYADERPVYVNWSVDLADQIARHREVAGDEMAPPWLLTGIGRADRITLASYPHRDPAELQEMRIAHIARLEPWLNLLDLGDVA